MKKSLFVIPAFFLSTATIAVEKSAEQMVSSKKKADMTYRQLMGMMGEASALIHQGLIRENKQMVEQGTAYILNHPAPKSKPWLIMHEVDQKEFKQSLLAFDQILDTHASRVQEEAKNNNWNNVAKASFDLTSSCIQCHAMWKEKVK